MIKVMIVDDEILARVGIKSMINWTDYGFRLIAECENGAQAQEKAEELKPDIIITDIRMPIVDGISLIKNFENKEYRPRFVVVSAYDDFKYVREAMKLGAEDYILKMEIDQNSLMQTLNKMKVKIENDDTENYRSVDKEKIIEKNNFKDQILRDLLFGSDESEDDIASLIDANNLNITNNNIFCLVITVDNNYIEDYDYRELYTLDNNIKDLLKDILSNYKYTRVISLRDLEYIVVHSFKEKLSTRQALANVEKMGIKIKDLLKKYTNLDFTIGISSHYNKYTQITSSYKEAIQAINHSFAYPRGSIIMYSDVEDSVETKKYGIFQNELDQLQRFLEIMNIKGILSVLSNITSRIEAERISKYYLEGVCSTIIYVVNKFAENNYILLEDIWEKDSNPYSEINHLSSIYDFIKWIDNTALKLKKVLTEYRQSNSIINELQIFINKNHNQDISLKDLAEYANMSANYLSNLFKKETGMTFIEYLTDCRIKHAKKLLKDSKYKVYEVAEMVGYKNVYYFSKVFKKHTGYSPNQYRAGNF